MVAVNEVVLCYAQLMQTWQTIHLYTIFVCN